MRSVFLKHSLLGFCLMGAAPAKAQDAEPVDTIPVQALPDPQERQADEATLVQLDTVRVSGDRLNRRLSETTTSTAIIRGADLERGSSEKFHEVIGSLGNVMRAQSDRQIAIRGVLQNGNGGGDSETISVYLDGIPLPQRAANFGGPLNAFDIDQIEVLRGPQSTSQGRNALAGAVFIKTRDAQPEWDAKALIGRGSFNGEQYALATGGPLLSPDFSFRLAFDERNSDGDIQNVTRNEDDAAREYTRLARLKLAYAREGSPYTAQLLGVASRNIFGDNVHDATNGERTQSADTRYEEKYRTGVLGLTQSLALGEQWSVSAATGFVRGVDHRDADFDRTEAPNGTSTFDLDDKSLTQELKASFASERLKAVMGVYGADLDQYSLVTGDDAVVGGGTVKLDGFVEYNKAVKTYAAFSEFEWRVFEPLSLTLGLRRNYESFKRRNVSDVSYQTASGGVPIPDAAVEAINTVGTSPLVPAAITDELRATGFIPLPQDYDQSGDTAFRVWLPKAGLTWHYLAGHSAGLTYSEGYRSGGTSISFFGGEKNDYDPEFTQNYELALRNRFFKGRVSANLNVFYTRWRQQQVEIGNNTDYYTVIRNAGRSHLYGAELEGDWRVSRPLRLSASLGYLHTEYDEFENLGEDYAGNRFNYAPSVSGGITAYWRVGGFDSSLNVTHTGSYYGNPSNSADTRSPGRTLLNARVAYAMGPLEFALFGRNLTNNLNVQDRFTLRSRQARRYGESRTLGVSLGIQLPP